MYPSDYTYTYALGIDNFCYYNGGDNCNGGKPTNGWIYNNRGHTYNWFLSPISDRSDYVVSLYVLGNVRKDLVTSSFGVCPSLYLVSQVKITSGDGSEQSPYQLQL